MMKFIKEGRMANQVETDAIVKAMEGFADREYGKEVECYAYQLYGRCDAPYGWYLFGISPIEEWYGSDKFADGQTEKFLILGDCLDVLPDYNRVLTLKDVHEFAIGEMDGRYEAIQEWGVFHSLSMPLKQMMCDFGGEDGLGEMMYWDTKRKEWKLRFDVFYQTEAGADEQTHISIPACFEVSKMADEEFAAEWDGYRKRFDVEEAAREYTDNMATFDEAYRWAKAKEQAIAHIGNAINYYIETGKTDYGKEKKADVDRGNRVWVLTIRKDGQNFPEVHRTFDGAVESALNDWEQARMDEDEPIDLEKRKQMREKLTDCFYCEDEDNDTTYDIVDCPLCK